MSTDEIYQRLAILAKQIEEHSTASWLLRCEREELRQRLRDTPPRPAFERYRPTYGPPA